MLRGWGHYFRTGNAEREFNKMDHYVYQRLTRWLYRRGGQRARRYVKWTSQMFWAMGLHKLQGTVRTRRTPLHRRSSLSRMRENRTYGLKGGIWKRASHKLVLRHKSPMAAAPNLPLVTVEEYLSTSYPDGDREYLDGIVVERNVGTPGHSALQKILIVHLAAFEKQFGIAVRPECRTRIAETRYRVADVVVMLRPFRQTDRIVLDAPLLIIEILSPDDRMGLTIQRFREYEKLGVRYIVQMDPDDRTTFLFINGDLIRRDTTELDVPERGSLPFPSRDLLALLDQE